MEWVIFAICIFIFAICIFILISSKIRKDIKNCSPHWFTYHDVNDGCGDNNETEKLKKGNKKCNEKT